MPEPFPPVCILAGGLGTRLGSMVADTPKPLITIAGEPFLVHQLRLLASFGATDAVVCVGYLGEQIVARIGPECCGVRLRYSHDGARPLGTLGAIRKAVPLLGDRFLVLYGDTYLRIDYAAVVVAWRESGLPAMMTVLRNKGAWDTSNVIFDGALVTAYDKRHPSAEMSWIDYGLGGLEVAALRAVSERESDLAELYRVLAHGRKLLGVEATERFYEIGTPSALVETSAFLTRLRASAIGGGALHGE